MIGLTKRQREVLNFIQAFIREHEYSPSFREIMAHFGFKSLASVHKHVHALKRKGFLTGEEHASRTLSPTEEEKEVIRENNGVDIPLMGQFSPGETIETFPKTSSISVPKHLVTEPESTYLLRLKGDTLHYLQLQHGDLLLVEARQTAETGEMAMLSDHEGHILIKRYEGEVALPLQGIVVGLLRAY